MYAIYLKYWDALSTYYTLPKIGIIPFYYLLMSLKYCWMTGKQCRLRSDTAECPIWVHTVCSSLSVPILWVNIVCTKVVSLTLNAPSKICRRRHSKLFFYFSEKTSLDISCESSAWQMIHMKCQDLFSLKNKKYIIIKKKNVVCCSCDWRFKG